MVSHIKVWPLGKMKGGERKKEKKFLIFVKLNPNQHSQGRKIWLSGLVV
jgi:hypothetical protein